MISQAPKQTETAPQQNGSNINLHITHNFAMFLIGVVVLGIVGFGSYTFLNLTQPKSEYKFTNNYDTFDPDGTLSDISVNPVFKKWLKDKKISYDTIESSHFSLSSIRKQINTIPKCNTEYGYKLINSPDNKKYVCFGSGGEPDSYLLLFDNLNNQSLRLAFCGTPCSYDLVFWLDNDKFVFLWTYQNEKYEEGVPVSLDSHYVVELYNINNATVYKWESVKPYY